MDVEMDRPGRKTPWFGGVSFDVQPRSDSRFDLYVTKMPGVVDDKDAARLQEQPIHNFVFDGRGPSDPERNPEGFLSSLPGENDLFQSFAFLFPPAPDTPLKLGTHWNGTRALPLGNAVAGNTVEFSYQVVDVGPCDAAPAEVCLDYQFSGRATAPDYQHKYSGAGRMTASGRFEGAYADLEGYNLGKLITGKLVFSRD